MCYINIACLILQGIALSLAKSQFFFTYLALHV